MVIIVTNDNIIWWVAHGLGSADLYCQIKVNIQSKYYYFMFKLNWFLIDSSDQGDNLFFVINFRLFIILSRINVL